MIENRWHPLRRFTPARIALGRSGVSTPTAAHLAFQLAHARARDSVHCKLDALALARGVRALGLDTVSLHSAAADRSIYLRRPDLGRQLAEPAREQLLALRRQRGTARHDVAFAIADGLSALAIQRHALLLLEVVLALLRDDDRAWAIAPAAIVEQGRVAIGDEIGELLDADIVVVLVGERPGLSSPDSLGLYLTWSPRPGRTDAERNCISNVRPEGLDYATAAARVVYLLREARRRGLTGIGLKDESGGALAEAVPTMPTFRLA